MSTFSEKVYRIVQQIPKGKVATYQQIAALAGNPKASRAVGMCMSKNTHPASIPCHRIVATSGALTGYAFGSIEKKKDKLLEEGITFIGNRVDLLSSQWGN